MKKILSLALTLVLALALCVPALAAGRDWEDAYAGAIRRHTENWGSVTKLVDLDLDGTPELLIGSYPGSGIFSLTEAAYTYKFGQLQQLTLAQPDSTHQPLTDFTLWFKPATGETRITADMTIRDSRDYSTDYTREFYLRNGVISGATKFSVATINNSRKAYYVDGRKTTKSNYDAALRTYKTGWTVVNNFATGDLTKGYGKPKSHEIDQLFANYKNGPIRTLASTHRVTVNGQPVSMGAYIFSGNNYFKLRDIAAALTDTGARFEVTWDSARYAIDLVKGSSYTVLGGELQPLSKTPPLGSDNVSPIFIDGVETTGLKAYTVNGNNYFKLRDVGEAMGFGVDWDPVTETVLITTEN